MARLPRYRTGDPELDQRIADLIASLGGVHDSDLVFELIVSAVRLARRLAPKVEVFDPVPAPLERKAGFERAQLLVRGSSRAGLQPFLRAWREALQERSDRRVRWSLDVDPQEV